MDGQTMTMAEINNQFDSEWVLIEDPQTNERLEVLGGKVILHSRDREDFDRKALSLHPKRFAVVYTGKIPENTAIVL